MPLPAWFARFCDPASDRFAVLTKVLQDSLVPFEVVTTGRFRHVQVRYQRLPLPQQGEKVLLAHYDRVPGTPGANDNGASVLALIDYLKAPRKRPLRVVFTDGEELAAGDAATAQGAFALASLWGRVPGLFPVVLDMTGIGDTVVLGHLGEHLLRQTRSQGAPADLDAYAKLRMGAKRFLATCGAGDTLEVNTPFSDDLGLFLAGLPAVQVSLLPRKEALAYRQVRAQPGELAGGDPGKLPASWQAMHGPHDTPATLWPASRTLMAQILDKLEGFPAF